MSLRNALLLRAVACCLVAAGLSSGCSKQPPAVHYDLAQDAAIAQWVFPDGERLLVTPVLKIHPRNRALRAEAEGDEPVRPRFEASVFLDWTDVAPRTAVLDLEAPAGLTGAQATVSLNADDIDRLVLSEGHRRYQVTLPEASQRTGRNRLRVAVDAPEPPSEDDADADPELPALLHGVAVGEAESAALAALVEEQAPVFELVRSAGVPTLVQGGPSGVRYAIRLPEDAELRFRPQRADDGGDLARLRVTLQAEQGEEQQLWSGSPVSGAAEEIAVALPGRAGELAWLTLHVDAGGEGRYATGVWAAPRVMGRGERHPLRATRLSEEQQTAGENLREALAGSNVLVLVLDAAAASHLGCYGYARPTTPEIDRLAAEGVVFERAYTPAPYTIAAMGSAWTSQYPDQHHHGVRHDAPLPRERLTLAEVVSAQGFDTAGFVSNPSAGRPFGLDRGFETFEHLYESDQPGFGGVPRAEEFQPAVEAWLGSRSGGRFLAYVHYLEPHFPYDPPPPFDTRFGPDTPLPREARRNDAWIRSVNDGKLQATPEQLEHLVRLYDGGLAYVDHEVGRLRAALESAGVWDETVVILTSDHGEALYEHGFIGHSFQLYEESIRVPLIIRFPGGKGPSGKRVEGLVDLLDIAPTIADIFGRLGKGGTAQAFEGRSLLAILGGAPTKQAVLARTMEERPAFALSDGAYKLIHSLKRGSSELYDLGDDPAEERNLSERHPVRTELYRQALYRWLRDLKREGGTAGSEALSPQELETLRALGYVS